VTLPNTVSVCT